jgi:hypothetical protein
VHEGKRLPESIALGLSSQVPVTAFAELLDAALKQKPKVGITVPPVLTFERLVSYSMVNYLSKQG